MWVYSHAGTGKHVGSTYALKEHVYVENSTFRKYGKHVENTCVTHWRVTRGHVMQGHVGVFPCWHALATALRTRCASMASALRTRHASMERNLPALSEQIGRGGFKAGRGRRPRIRLVLPSPAPTGRARPRWPGASPVRPSGAWFGVWALLPHFRGRFRPVKNANQAPQISKLLRRSLSARPILAGCRAFAEVEGQPPGNAQGIAKEMATSTAFFR
jgi:hypothetical protein